MAKIRLFGSTFNATPLSQLPNGNWKMMAHGHTARCVPGSVIEVHPREIVDMETAAQPIAGDLGLGALEAAMADERKTLPTVQELLAASKAGNAIKPVEPTQ